MFHHVPASTGVVVVVTCDSNAQTPIRNLFLEQKLSDGIEQWSDGGVMTC